MDEIEETLKRIYEETLMDCIHRNKGRMSFIDIEIESESYVQIIQIKRYSKSGHCSIITERGGSQLSVLRDSHKEELEALFKKHNVERYLTIEKDIREWYDTYLVPRLKKAIDVQKL